MTANPLHLTLEQLEAGLEEIQRSPKDAGPVDMICIRPTIDGRECPSQVELSTDLGVVGDNWIERPSKLSADKKSASKLAQICIMNSRAAQLITRSRDRWALAGDQFFVDFDLSEANLPAGTQLQLGTAVLEVSVAPHNGCLKFAERFGNDALKFVNSAVGFPVKTRGINVTVIKDGAVSVGDEIRKL